MDQDESSDEDLFKKHKQDETLDEKKTRNENKRLKCAICLKQYTHIKSWRQHIESHMNKRKCEKCGKSYVRLEDLHKHQEKKHGLQHIKGQKQTCLTCDSCSKTFGRKFNLDRHKARVHKRVIGKQSTARFSCRHCQCEFQCYDQLFKHVHENHPIQQQGGRRAITPPLLNVNDAFNHQNENQEINRDTSMTADVQEATTDAENNVEGTNSDTENSNKNQKPNDKSLDESALRNGVMNRILQPSGSERYDILTFFGNIRDQIRAFLQSRVQSLGGVKWNLCVHVEMEREDEENVTTTLPYFRSRTYMTLSVDDLSEHDLNEALQKMFASLEEYIRRGSGWYVKKVLKLEINTVVYKPLGGSEYLPLPKSLSLSNSLLNIQNQDEKCFLYCLLASLHPTSMEPERVEHYYQYAKEIDMSGIIYPVTLAQVRKVENQNENISVNIFTFEDNTIVPLRITEKCNRLHHVNLLWLKYGELSHYCLITDLNRFLYRTNKHCSQLYFCSYCLHGFRRETLLKEHQQYCARHEAQRVELPTPGKNDILKFKEYEKMLNVPCVIYCDLETINRKIDTCAPNQQHSSTTFTTHLEVCGFGYKVVCADDNRYTKPSVIYRGKDAAKRLIECLLREQDEIQAILSTIQPMRITKENENLIQNATHCCLCKKQFSTYDKTYERIVRHHSHLTGELIGPACNTCNINCKQADFIPVIFHNLKNFDAHILCQQLGYFKDHKVKCIAQNSERYVSFSLNKLRFIDSFQFLPASLESLIENLAQEGLQAFPHLLSETDSVSIAQLLLRKGVYPYEFMDSFEKFNEPELPPKEAFYSTIKKEHISKEDYEHATDVFKTFNMTCLGEYHDLYLKTDVVLLSDVFESFRVLCQKQYELDPCQFYTSPGLSWSACLKMTGVQLELLTDIDQILMIESGIRGGMSQISNRYKKANNPYLEDYDPSMPNISLQYLDANNLYGWAMIQALPIGEFMFLEKREIESFDVMSIPDNNETGYILEVSLHYPESLHDSHNCLPLAPVKRAVTNEELSPYAQQLLRKLHGLSKEDPLPNRGKNRKLLTTLEDKDLYVLHYRNLKLYLRLGMKLKAIHRILKFRQEPWMKKYIDQNTDMRKKATSTFQKNFYKLMNVSVFGKTMENVRLHKNIELIHTEGRLKKVTSKPSYKNTIIFSEELVAVEMYRPKVNLFKPIYCGMSILDLSKCLMYEFWYSYMKTKYKESAQLQMSDTDSYLFSCETEDLYKDMNDSIDFFDTSEYPKNHFLQSDRNKKVLGKFKDETCGTAISEFVGLRSKMYSFMCNGKEEKRAKGIAKVTVSKELKHDCYKKTLFKETSMIASMSTIRSHKHELFGETITKIGLSAFDDKRYLIDAVKSYAYGHYKITGDGKNSNTCNMATESNTPLISIEKKLIKDQILQNKSFTIGDFTITPLVNI